MSTATEDPPTIAIAFGRAVRAARNAKGLSQRQLAEDAGIGDRTVQYVESGAISTTLDTAGEIARALGTPLSELLAS